MNEAVRHVDNFLLRRTILAINKDIARIFSFLDDCFRLNNIDCNNESVKFIDKSKRGKI